MAEEQAKKTINWSNVLKILGCILMIIAIIGVSKWSVDQWFPTKVSQPVITTTAPAATLPTTIPTNNTFAIKWQGNVDRDFPNGPSIANTQQMLGVNVVRVGTEFSCFNWRGIPYSTKVKLVKGFIFTVHLPGDKVIVVNGNDKVIDALAFTARWIDAYPSGDAVFNGKILAEKETRHMMGPVTFVTDI